LVENVVKTEGISSVTIVLFASTSFVGAPQSLTSPYVVLPTVYCLQIALSNTEAIDFVENVIKTEGISCGFTRCPAFVLPSSADKVPGDSRDPRSSSSGGKSDKQAGGCPEV
jgi:hypothetical protein